MLGGESITYAGYLELDQVLQAQHPVGAAELGGDV